MSACRLSEEAFHSCTVGRWWDSADQFTHHRFYSPYPGVFLLLLCGQAQPSPRAVV